ncbi:hypothetical protein GUJ93_ZPchr0012g21159 [Zizania palustris]|uniref:Uncharacterized protein n=1 Tax=Zizania palustris TaxID=103762 RepID=A0A8J5WND0_ZIZPA|nr:hypothetical protein GUJ93_ZPchr0012g21159 [Zizania palustris]
MFPRRSISESDTIRRKSTGQVVLGVLNHTLYYITGNSSSRIWTIQKCEGKTTCFPSTEEISGEGNGKMIPSCSSHSRRIYIPPFEAALLTTILTSHRCHDLDDDDQISWNDSSYPAMAHCPGSACHGGDWTGCLG